jgi:hypothetical protein
MVALWFPATKTDQESKRLHTNDKGIGGRGALLEKEKYIKKQMKMRE